jgi:hypothetical protein
MPHPPTSEFRSVRGRGVQTGDRSAKGDSGRQKQNRLLAPHDDNNRCCHWTERGAWSPSEIAAAGIPNPAGIPLTIAFRLPKVSTL